MSAIKLFHPARTATVRIRFAAEAQALARLSHPGLVGIHDAGVDDGDRSYLVMQLVDGEACATACSPPAGPGRGAGPCARWPRRWPTCTPKTWSTATSSRPTSCWTSRRRPYLADFGIALLLDAARNDQLQRDPGHPPPTWPRTDPGEPVGHPPTV